MTAALKVASETQFKIETNIPVPDLISGARKYPFNEMKVGDSFAVSPDIKGTIGVAAHAFGKKHGWKFTVRKDGHGTIRCWRVA